MAHLIFNIVTLFMLIVVIGVVIGLVHRRTAEARKNAGAPWKRDKKEPDNAD